MCMCVYTYIYIYREREREINTCTRIVAKPFSFPLCHAPRRRAEIGQASCGCSPTLPCYASRDDAICFHVAQRQENGS